MKQWNLTSHISSPISLISYRLSSSVSQCQTAGACLHPAHTNGPAAFRRQGVNGREYVSSRRRFCRTSKVWSFKRKLHRVRATWKMGATWKMDWAGRQSLNRMCVRRLSGRNGGVLFAKQFTLEQFFRLKQQSPMCCSFFMNAQGFVNQRK